MRSFRVNTLPAMAAVVAIALASQTAVADDPQATETRTLEEFTKVRVYGAFNGTITAGKEHGVVLKGDEEVLPYVLTEVEGSTLKIKLKKDTIRRYSIDLDISTEALEEVRIDGAGNFDITGVDSDEFELNLPGASKLTVSGKCDDFEVRISGFASIEAKDFECNNATLKISGHGKISVYANESLETRISGLGKITVYGDPKEVDQKISGLGRVSFNDKD